LSTIVGFALLNFRSHVGHGASVRLEWVDAFVASESEVSNLQVELLVNENVLKL
jgi:hypothetical protein